MVKTNMRKLVLLLHMLRI